MEEKQERYSTILSCQRVIRLATVVILSAFVVIIVASTLSTEPVVQVGVKVLYYLIVLSILLSLATWAYRTRLEKRLGRSLSEILEEVAQ